MARAKWCGDEVYAAADSFKERCLRLDGSLFEPQAEIWSVEHLEELWARVGIVDLGGGSFIEKLEGQLSGLSDAEIRLGAELLYVLLLPELDTHGPTKREHLKTILGMLPTAVELPEQLDRALDAGGVANFAAAKAHRDAYMRFMARISGRIKEIAAPDRDRVLDDPWEFRSVVTEVRTTTDGMQANALLHLFYPETFEYMISDGHRQMLTSTFAESPGVAEVDDVDRTIGLIRELAGAGGELDFDLYEDPFQRIWKEPASPGWEEAIEWSRLLYERADFDETERTYKLDVAAKVAAARDALLAGDRAWSARLRDAFSDRRNNLTSWRAKDPLLDWCEQNPDEADRTLRLLWDRPEGEPELRAFLDSLPAAAVSGPGTRLSIASFLLLGLDATRWTYFKSTVHRGLLNQLGEEGTSISDPDPEAVVRPEELAKQLGIAGERVRGFLRDRYPRAERDQYSAWYLTADQTQSVIDRFSDEIDMRSGEATYAAWTAMLEELRLRMLAAGEPLRDLLDAQSIAYWLTQGQVPEDWSPEQRSAFNAFRRGESGTSDGAVAPVTGKALLPPATPELGARVHLPISWLNELFGLLEEKRQVVLYGPPGTGKTYIAQRVGDHIAAAGGSVRLVQFHPSYTYEDFFEGYRPIKHDGEGTLSFDLVPGALRRIAEDAANAPTSPIC